MLQEYYQAMHFNHLIDGWKKKSSNVLLLYRLNLFHLHKYQHYKFEMYNTPHSDCTNHTSTIRKNLEEKLVMELVDKIKWTIEDHQRNDYNRIKNDFLN